MAIANDYLAALASEHRLDDLRTAAEHQLKAGTPREQVIAELESLRADASEGEEDAVLDVLDFVTGWCSPHARI